MDEDGSGVTLIYVCYSTQSCMLPCLIQFHLVVLYAAQTVVLNSSVGMRQACPGETVTYTCTVNQGFVLEWVVEPFLPFSSRIQLRSTDTIMTRMNCTDVAAVRCEDFNFVATLIATANPINVMGTTLADMTSTLTFTATARLNGIVVQCRGTTGDGLRMNSTVNIAGASLLLFVSIVFDACCLK